MAGIDAAERQMILESSISQTQNSVNLLLPNLTKKDVLNIISQTYSTQQFNMQVDGLGEILKPFLSLANIKLDIKQIASLFKPCIGSLHIISEIIGNELYMRSQYILTETTDVSQYKQEITNQYFNEIISQWQAQLIQFNEEMENQFSEITSIMQRNLQKQELDGQINDMINQMQLQDFAEVRDLTQTVQIINEQILKQTDLTEQYRQLSQQVISSLQNQNLTQQTKQNMIKIVNTHLQPLGKKNSQAQIKLAQEFKAQLNQEIKAYKAQIDQLTQQIQNINIIAESQNRKLIEEQQQILSDKDNTINNLKQQFIDFDKSHQAKADEYKQQIQTLTETYNNQKNILQEELNKITQQYSSQILQLQNTIKQNQITIDEINQKNSEELRLIAQKLDLPAQSSVANILQQIQTNNALNEQQLIALEGKIKFEEQRITGLQQDLQQQTLSQQKQLREQKLEFEKQKEDEINNLNKEFEQKVQNLEVQFRLQMQDIKSLAAKEQKEQEQLIKQAHDKKLADMQAQFEQQLQQQQLSGKELYNQLVEQLKVQFETERKSLEAKYQSDLAYNTQLMEKELKQQNMIEAIRKIDIDKIDITQLKEIAAILQISGYETQSNSQLFNAIQFQLKFNEQSQQNRITDLEIQIQEIINQKESLNGTYLRFKERFENMQLEKIQLNEQIMNLKQQQLQNELLKSQQMNQLQQQAIIDQQKQYARISDLQNELVKLQQQQNNQDNILHMTLNNIINQIESKPQIQSYNAIEKLNIINGALLEAEANIKERKTFETQAINDIQLLTEQNEMYQKQIDTMIEKSVYQSLLKQYEEKTEAALSDLNSINQLTKEKSNLSQLLDKTKSELEKAIGRVQELQMDLQQQQKINAMEIQYQKQIAEDITADYNQKLEIFQQQLSLKDQMIAEYQLAQPIIKYQKELIKKVIQLTEQYNDHMKQIITRLAPADQQEQINLIQLIDKIQQNINTKLTNRFDSVNNYQQSIDALQITNQEIDKLINIINPQLFSQIDSQVGIILTNRQKQRTKRLKINTLPGEVIYPTINEMEVEKPRNQLAAILNPRSTVMDEEDNQTLEGLMKTIPRVEDLELPKMESEPFSMNKLYQPLSIPVIRPNTIEFEVDKRLQAISYYQSKPELDEVIDDIMYNFGEQDVIDSIQTRLNQAFRQLSQIPQVTETEVQTDAFTFTQQQELNLADTQSKPQTLELPIYKPFEEVDTEMRQEFDIEDDEQIVNEEAQVLDEVEILPAVNIQTRTSNNFRIKQLQGYSIDGITNKTLSKSSPISDLSDVMYMQNTGENVIQKSGNFPRVPDDPEKQRILQQNAELQNKLLEQQLLLNQQQQLLENALQRTAADRYENLKNVPGKKQKKKADKKIKKQLKKQILNQEKNQSATDVASRGALLDAQLMQMKTGLYDDEYLEFLIYCRSLMKRDPPSVRFRILFDKLISIYKPYVQYQKKLEKDQKKIKNNKF